MRFFPWHCIKIRRCIISIATNAIAPWNFQETRQNSSRIPGFPVEKNSCRLPGNPGVLAPCEKSGGTNFGVSREGARSSDVNGVLVTVLPIWQFMISKVVVVIVCITRHVTSTTEQQRLQPSEAVVGHPPAWSVGSCWRYETLFDVCHTDTRHSLQGPTFCGTMHS